jgi:arsenate reductase
MKSAITLATVLVFGALVNAQGGETALVEPLRPSAKRAIGEFEQISPERKKDLERAASFVRGQLDHGKAADVTFVCTHNSRRSHLSQIWAQTAAAYYGLTNVTTYSGGTEATACNIRTVRALRRAGFSIAQSTGGTNPVYLAQYSESLPAARMYSKRFASSENPQKDFAAIFSCDDAADKCPVVEGAALRLPIVYVDPKVTDNTPAEAATYDERSRQIAREMFYLMSSVRQKAVATADR